MAQIFSALTQFFTSLLIFTVSLVVGLITVFVGYKIIGRIIFRNSLTSKLKRRDKTFLLIKLSSNNEYKEQAMADFLMSLHRVLPNNTEISLEMVSSNQFLHFYIVVPKTLKGLVESQLYAQFPAKITAFGADNFKRWFWEKCYEPF